MFGKKKDSQIRLDALRSDVKCAISSQAEDIKKCIEGLHDVSMMQEPLKDRLILLEDTVKELQELVQRHEDAMGKIDVLFETIQVIFSEGARRLDTEQVTQETENV